MKYPYQIQIIYTKFYGFKNSYLILKIIWFQVIISISVLENDTNKLLWDFNIQTDHLIPARRPDLIIINQKKRNSLFLLIIIRSADYYKVCCPGGPQNKSEGM